MTTTFSRNSITTTLSRNSITTTDNSHPQDYSQQGHQALPTIITVLTV